MTNTKASELIEVLDRLRGDLGSDAFVDCDHWDADLCATGIGRIGDPGFLAYISVFKQPAGRYFLELERPAADMYEVVGTWESTEYPELLSLVTEHLDVRSLRFS